MKKVYHVSFVTVLWVFVLAAIMPAMAYGAELFEESDDVTAIANMQVTTLKRLYLHDRPYARNRLKDYIAPQEVTITAQYQDWYRINTWIGSNWIHPQEVVIGKFDQKNETLVIKDNVTMYQYPLETSKVLGTLSPRTAISFEQYGDWHHINSPRGQVWVKLESPIMRYKLADVIAAKGQGGKQKGEDVRSQNDTAYYDKYISGYHFIFLSNNKSIATAGNNQIDASQQQLLWLETALEENHLPGKPIFVFLLKPQGASSREGEESFSAQLKDLLGRYPEVILFRQTDGITVINRDKVIISNKARAWGSGQKSLLLEVYQDKVVITDTGLDVQNFLNGKRYVIENIAPKASAAVDSPWTDEVLIAHGLGGINGHRVTNTLEALQNSYEKGFRVFEMDLILTQDKHLVGRHDWMKYMYPFLGENVPADQIVEGPLSLAAFKSLTVFGEYNHIDAVDLARLMTKYPDAYIITDTKTTLGPEIEATFRELVSVFQKYNPAALDRLIIQIYNQDMLRFIKKYYDFPNIIYSMYQSADTDDEALDFVIKNNLDGIAVLDTEFTPQLAQQAKEKGVYLYVHTVNDKAAAQQYINNGAQSVWTDYLDPGDVTRGVVNE